MKRKTYWVYLNGKYIADYRTLRGCLDFIERRKLEVNYDNDLGIIDNEGNEYHPYTGKIMNESINEWNMWDGDRRSSYPRQTRLIDVADNNRRPVHNSSRYKNDPEYHEHIKRLEDELRRTEDPQHAEYLERRISKLRSLSENELTGYTSQSDLEKQKTFDVFNKSTYEDGYDEAYDLGYNDAKHHIAKDIIESDFEAKDLAYEIAINNWGADFELADDEYFISEVKRGYNDGFLDWEEKHIDKKYSRRDNEFYRRHHGHNIDENVKTSRTSRAINEMARKKKVYQVVAKCDYRDRSTEYVCDEFTSKRDALRYMKEECYDTPSRSHIIREVIKDDINEGERSSAIRNNMH